MLQSVTLLLFVPPNDVPPLAAQISAPLIGIALILVLLVFLWVFVLVLTRTEARESFRKWTTRDRWYYKLPRLRYDVSMKLGLPKDMSEGLLG